MPYSVRRVRYTHGDKSAPRDCSRRGHGTGSEVPMQADRITHYYAQWAEAGIEYGLCLCGCGEPTTISSQTVRGRFKGEPTRYLTGHHRRKSLAEYEEDDRGYRTPCWIWQRAVDSGGYGQTFAPRNSAHRAYYERARGPIPVGLDVDHLCRVRLCVNPDHLEAVPRRENIRRGAGCKLTAAQVLDIRSSSLSNAELGRRLDVSAQHVGRIRQGLHWEVI